MDTSKLAKVKIFVVIVGYNKENILIWMVEIKHITQQLTFTRYLMRVQNTNNSQPILNDSMVSGREESTQKAGIKFLLRALKSKNYRMYFVGLGISFIGTWMQRIAIGWLSYRLTNSEFILGLVGFASLLPSFFVAPVAGVLADRWDRRKMLMITQFLAMAQAGILAVLVATGVVSVVHIMVLGCFLGIINGFDIPIRHSFVVEIVDKRDDLPNAIALNSLLFNGARLVGPVLAGFVISSTGESFCFLLNALSYGVFMTALMIMNVRSKTIDATQHNVFQKFKEGCVYAFGSVEIRSILIVLSVASLMSMPYFILLPVFARDILGGGAHTLGFLMAASGLGAIIGVVFLASRESAFGLETSIAAATVIMSLGLIGFAYSRVMWFSLFMMVVIGYGMMVQLASSNTVLQTIVDDDKRGRIMSFYSMTFLGMTPVGSLFGGWLASHIGAPTAVFIGGISCLIGSLVFVRNIPLLREKIMPFIGKDTL